MCGRFAMFQEIEPLVADLNAVDLADPHLRARWNIPPTAPIYVVTESLDKETGEVLRALRVARWGLLPPFASDESFSSRTFNARRETVADKPSFRGALAGHRAIVPMNGYYEWKRPDTPRGVKQPYWIRRRDGAPLFMAALVSWWRGPGRHEGPAASADGAWLLSATILTRASHENELGALHDRTPAMLDRAGVDAWLSREMDSREEAAAWINEDAHLLEDSALELVPVDRAVGSVTRDGPELLEPCGEAIPVTAPLP